MRCADSCGLEKLTFDSAGEKSYNDNSYNGAMQMFSGNPYR